MGTVNFYLKKAIGKGKDTRSLIILQFKFNGNRLVYSFGQTIHPDNWNANKQRIKSNATTTADGKHLLNDLLDNLERECYRAYNTELKNGIPTPDKIRGYLRDFINQNGSDPNKPNFYSLLDRFIAGEIKKNKGGDRTKSTLTTFSTLKNHLREFTAKRNYNIDFDTINIDFFHKYTSYLKDQLKLSQNTIAKDIKKIKVVMGEAVELEYTHNTRFRSKKFSVSGVDGDSVYLTEKELMDLFNFDFSHNKRLESIRDLFIFGAFTGLRYSDYSTIKPENIIKVDGDYFIKIITQKTKDVVIIPANPIVLKIFKRYEKNINKLPVSISNQKFNEGIKDVCEEAGLTEVGRLTTGPTKPLYKCVSSHTARRSFATNLYLEGFPVIDLMKITTHRTEKAFLNYIKVSKLDAAKRLSAHIKTMWSKKLLKVAG